MTTSVPKNHGHLCYPFGDTASTDEAILAAVLNALHWHPGIPQDQVKVEVRQGCAVLSGKLARDVERELAEQSASTTPGVIEVTNLIIVKH
jgi:osmotically-inducible protein OsmY